MTKVKVTLPVMIDVELDYQDGTAEHLRREVQQRPEYFQELAQDVVGRAVALHTRSVKDALDAGKVIAGGEWIECLKMNGKSTITVVEGAS